jgi:hypothetical protein
MRDRKLHTFVNTLRCFFEEFWPPVLVVQNMFSRHVGNRVTHFSRCLYQFIVVLWGVYSVDFSDITFSSAIFPAALNEGVPTNREILMDYMKTAK